MNLAKKILIVHGDTVIRRQLVLLLAGTGLDVRAFSTAAAAAEVAHDEWFDLALVAHNLPDTPDLSFVAALRKIQPTVPVLILVTEIELALVIQGIRLGVADVMLETDDLRPVVRRIRSLIKLDPDAVADVTAEELAQAEAALEKMGVVGDPHSADPFGTHTEAPAVGLLRVTKEKALLAAQVERLSHERAALEAQLKTIVAQNAELARLPAESAELHSQREIVAAAQTAIDEKARALAGQRAELARERRALADERQKLAATTPVVAKGEQEIARERTELTDWRLKLIEEAERLQGETLRLQQDRMQLALERRRWHEDLDVLRQQEENLRSYEKRLRELQGQLEADRVVYCSTNMKQASHSPFTDDAALREAWAKLQRASEILETERAHFREDKLALRDWEKTVKGREDSLSAREARVAEQEQRLREAFPAIPVSAPPPASTMRSFTRAPFSTAKAVLLGKK
ncbi:MAG TPA: response regulator [Opitutaceae bacterium]|nr:response regulator [Opitutaceae bacterium]